MASLLEIISQIDLPHEYRISISPHKMILGQKYYMRHPNIVSFRNDTIHSMSYDSSPSGEIPAIFIGYFTIGSIPSSNLRKMLPGALLVFGSETNPSNTLLRSFIDSDDATYLHTHINQGGIIYYSYPTYIYSDIEVPQKII